MARTVPQPIVTRAGRLPARIQYSQFGSSNSNIGGQVGRVVNRPIITQPGPVTALTQSEHREINELQQNARLANQISRANPFANGNLLQNVILVPGPNVLSHGLGQPFQGAFLLNPQPVTDPFEFFTLPTYCPYSVSRGTSPESNIIIYTPGPNFAFLTAYSTDVVGLTIEFQVSNGLGTNWGAQVNDTVLIGSTRTAIDGTYWHINSISPDGKTFEAQAIGPLPGSFSGINGSVLDVSLPNGPGETQADIWVYY
jgi:hypothetical protein